MAPPNVKIKHITRSPSSSGDTRFPKLDDCAHFHYENVELGPITVHLCDKQADSSKSSMVSSSSASKENEGDRICFLVTVISNRRKWVVKRSYKNFMFLDTQLHRCVYDRKYSLLHELTNITEEHTEGEDNEEKIRNFLSEYLERFSQLAGSLINCGPVLNWFELDNRGNRLIVTDEVAINTPAVAASYVVVPYSAQATDEISFDVGDMISVIDMPPPEESSWWRGKKGFEVGFFPSECVEVIGDKVPHSFKLSGTSTKPVFRKHGKLIAFFRSFLLSRPSRRRLKQSGILKERVFGCDLGEHLLNTVREIPLVLKCCTEFIEEHGVVDGIYRLSGVSSNIQRLRLAFDEDRAINLGDPETVHDIHSVASLLKMYFRELPNPLLTYQLYDKFVSAVQSCEEVRLLRIRDVVQQLPPPHFRTLQYLLSHLARVASYGDETGMTPKNIAIVWAPNLLRSRDVENGGVGALHVVGVQAVLTEYLIRFSDLIFDEKVPMLTSTDHGEGITLRTRPKSLAISTPTKLLSLEEARARALSTHLPLTQQKYIEVGGGPDKLPSKYHTVIDLPMGKQGHPKLKKSPSGWKSFFSRGWYSGSTRDKCRPVLRTSRKASTGSLPPTSVYSSEKPAVESDSSCNHRKKLRTVKSAESLIQCVKESQNETKDDVLGISHKSPSPLASTDSSNSFEVASPLSKSPSLQKHARSSSHESYFESNSMDIISEPSFEEEEHGLFYYVTEQMRILQDASSQLLWSTSNNDAKKEALLFRHSKVFDPNSSDLEMDHISSDTEKVVRKQKLSAVDDFANAKVQKLSEKKILFDDSPECSRDFEKQDLSCSSNSPTMDYTLNISPLQQSSSIEKYYLVPDSDNLSPNSSFMDNSEFQLDPILIYDAIINKHSSCITPSENENGSRTVVERYGNAETVLVEVHATQDSSSEEEHSLSHSPVIKEKEFDKSMTDACSIITDVLYENQELKSKSYDVNEHDISTDRLSDRDSVISDTDMQNMTVIEKYSSESNTEQLDSHAIYGNDESSEEAIDIYDLEPSTITPVINHEISESVLLPESLISRECDLSNDLTESKQNEVAYSSLVPRNRDLTLKLDASPKEDSCKMEQFNDSSASYGMNTPPSPVYPSKSAKFEDFQSLRIKMENIPIHKKKKILNIPSPSSPVEEVRKKFELHAANSQRQVDSVKSDAKSSPSSKEVSKLTSKQKMTFEKSELSESGEKRKSEGLQSSKSDMMFGNKRFSEPSPKTQKTDIEVAKKSPTKSKADGLPLSTSPVNHVEPLHVSRRSASNVESTDMLKSPVISVEPTQIFKIPTTSNVEASQVIKSPVSNVESPHVISPVSKSEPMQISKSPVTKSESMQVAKSPVTKSDTMQISKSPVTKSDPMQISKSPVTKSEPMQIAKSPALKSEPMQVSKSPVGYENQSGKNKQLQPSLFTQLKIRKLQSLKGDKNVDPPATTDPWSDPILDMQEDYHPMISLSQLEEAKLASELSPKPKSYDDSVESEQLISEERKASPSKEKADGDSIEYKEASEAVKTDEVLEMNVAKLDFTVSPNTELDCSNLNSEFENRPTSVKPSEVGVESEAVKRERINRIKEERRAQLREKLKTESFRLEAEEKEKVQTKFRLRKDSLRHSGQIENLEDPFCKEVTKSDKAVETDSTDIAETGTYCDLGTEQSDSLQSKTSEQHSSTNRSSVSELDHSKFGRHSLKQVLSEADIIQQKPTSGRKSNRTYEDSRKWLSMPPSDIRDKVAIFERSKDTNELCRLGPSGKFPPKQNTSTLASSFVR